MDLDFRAVDQHGVEDLGRQVVADASLDPIILGGDGPGQFPHAGRQRGPEDDGIQVAGVIGEVDPLAGIGLRVDPPRTAPLRSWAVTASTFLIKETLSMRVPGTRGRLLDLWPVDHGNVRHTNPKPSGAPPALSRFASGWYRRIRRGKHAAKNRLLS